MMIVSPDILCSNSIPASFLLITDIAGYWACASLMCFGNQSLAYLGRNIYCDNLLQGMFVFKKYGLTIVRCMIFGAFIHILYYVFRGFERGERGSLQILGRCLGNCSKYEALSNVDYLTLIHFMNCITQNRNILR